MLLRTIFLLRSALTLAPFLRYCKVQEISILTVWIRARGLVGLHTLPQTCIFCLVVLIIKIEDGLWICVPRVFKGLGRALVLRILEITFGIPAQIVIRERLVLAVARSVQVLSSVQAISVVHQPVLEKKI